MLRRPRITRLSVLTARIAEQEQWIKEHGGNLAGYVARYGAEDDPGHYGDGGEAIYKADRDALDALRAQLNADRDALDALRAQLNAGRQC